MSPTPLHDSTAASIDEASADDIHWEQRWQPLRREWVVIAAHRQNRPWSGQNDRIQERDRREHDPTCYLCPGVVRASGAINPPYTDTLVFDNDFPCVGPAAPPRPARRGAGPYRTGRADGLARVVCYSPRHDLSLAELGVAGVDRLLVTWQEQWRELSARPEVNHLLFFENRGEQVGVSNPHPHCQIYATNFVFKTIANEAVYAAEHHRETGRSLLGDMIEREMRDADRLLHASPSAVAFVPHCARYPYETFVAPRRCVPNIAALDKPERQALAEALSETLIRFDNLWQTPFPYVMALHQAPCDGRDHPGFHFHIEFHPPLRKPDLLKFPAGPEIGGGNFISDTWPEDKAEELRLVPTLHHRHTKRSTGASAELEGSA